ncbi:MAG: hypothetical protein HKN29_16415, partial [Rhodothermales bacterium]|nr:hypothetical protein [Rhodothermales bacterium]
GGLPVVRITLAQEDLDTILAAGNEQSDVEYLATFRWESPQLTAEVDSIGFRLRGNTSRNSRKKSFKVSFNTFRQGGKWEGLEKLNLNGEHNDPSIIRSKLSWDIFREFDVPASRANHVELYINGAYFGLYINVEHVDEQFLNRYFGNNDGNLYKALWPADLTVRGGDGDAYRPSGGDRRPYDLTQGASDQEGYDDLAAFINLINNTSGSGFRGAIERAMDVDGFLRAQAVTVLTGSWDTYWFLKNNFYLYNNPATGKWHYVPFDFDNTFGIYWDGISSGLDWATRDVYDWGHPTEERPLMERILAVPEFRERYTYYLRELLESAFLASRLESEIARLKTLTEAAAEADTYRTLDYGFTVQDYHDSFTAPLADHAHVTAGLIPFVTQRYLSALGQLDGGSVAPLISSIEVLPERPRPSDSLRVSAKIETRSIALAQVEYWPDVPQRQTVMMVPGSGDFYHAILPPLGNNGTMDLRIRAVDGAGAERQSALLRIGVDDSKPPVYINELQARNETTVADEFGEFDDWVELFNASDIPAHVGGWSLSDDPANTDRFVLPDVFIPEQGHLLVWLDAQPEQGDLHAPFRLAGAGESLGLYEANGLEVDYVSFGAQVVDESFLRSPDASPYFVSGSFPTPGEPNPIVESVEDGPRAPQSFAVYPNPFQDHVSIRGGAFEVYDVLGRRVHGRAIGAQPGAPGIWDASAHPAGLYFVREISSGHVTPVMKVR